MSLLCVEKVSKNFGGLWALRDVGLTVEEGTIHGLMGANGAGKTTLFSLIAGNQRLSSGRILFDGRPISGLRPDQICRAGVGRTFQIVRPFAGLSLRENVEAAVLFGRKDPPSFGEAAKIALDILRDLELARSPDAPAHSLTLSDLKRLEVARALATEPRLLLLDEVMAGLTPAEVEEMIGALQRIRVRYGLTIFIVEHVVQALTRMSDCITVLHHGEMIAEGSPAEIASHPEVMSAYFGEGPQ